MWVNKMRWTKGMEEKGIEKGCDKKKGRMTVFFSCSLFFFTLSPNSTLHTRRKKTGILGSWMETID